MADANQAPWWRKTERLAAIVLSGFAAVMCVPLLFADSLDRSTLLGLPFGHLLISLVTPVVLAIATIWRSILTFCQAASAPDRFRPLARASISKVRLHRRAFIERLDAKH